MRLSEAESRKLPAKYGVYVPEACDGCRKILGPVRFTRYGLGGALQRHSYRRFSDTEQID